MNPDDYCKQQAAPPGSTVYYAVREASAARRPGLIALYALRHELETSVRETSDVAVGRIKLAWWRNEIDAACAGTATHPITQALALHCPTLPALRELLLALTDGYELDMAAARHLDFHSLTRYARATGGVFAELIAAYEAAPAIAPPPWAAGLGIALTLADTVRDVGADARHGRIDIPIDEMQRFGVTAAAILNRRHDDAFIALMTFETARARTALQAARAAMPHGARRVHAVLRAQAAMALDLLDVIEADGFHVLDQRIALTPLRKLWAAWRGAHRR